MKKTLFLIILSVVLLCCSCGDKAQSSVTNNSDQSSEYFEYTIIRGDTCSDEIKKAASTLRKALKDASGLEVKLGSDYNTKATKYEILIGETKRAESKAYSELGPKSYVIDNSTPRIVIKGGTDVDTVEAVNYFIENYIVTGKKVITFPAGEKYENIFEYPKVVVNENDLKDYVICNNGGLNEWILGDFITKVENAYGYKLPIVKKTGEKTIIIELDSTIGEKKYKCYIENDNIYILGSDEISLLKAFSILDSAIPQTAKEGKEIVLKLNKEGRRITSVLEEIENGSQEVKYFVVETDRDSLDYKVGDKITFEAKLLVGDEVRSAPLFKWSISCEGENGEEKSGFVSGADGKITVETTMDVPGFALLTVEACDANGTVISGIDKCSAGAGAGVSDIKVSVEEPEDWEEFWQNQLARLDAVKPVALEMKEDGSTGGYYVYDVKIACPGNEKWTGETYSAIYVSVPKNADPKSLGIKVKFMGAGARSTETHLSRDLNNICVSVNGHSLPSKMSEEYYYQILYQGALINYEIPKADEKDPAEVYYSYMVMRDLQALRWVKSYFGESGENLWDGENLEVSGMSEGGFQALFTAALDKDVTSCIADVPAMCDKQGIHHGRKKSYGAAIDLMLYYDTCFFAKRITCPTTILVGLGDTTCVPSGITAMYNELKCEKSITYVQNVGHGYPNAQKIQQQFFFSAPAKK